MRRPKILVVFLGYTDFMSCLKDLEEYSNVDVKACYTSKVNPCTFVSNIAKNQSFFKCKQSKACMNESIVPEFLQF